MDAYYTEWYNLFSMIFLSSYRINRLRNADNPAKTERMRDYYSDTLDELQINVLMFDESTRIDSVRLSTATSYD